LIAFSRRHENAKCKMRSGRGGVFEGEMSGCD
jgi:hypothetical protein